MSENGRIYEMVAPEGDVLTHYWGTDEQDAIRQHWRCYCLPFWAASAYPCEKYWEQMQKDGFTIRVKT